MATTYPGGCQCGAVRYEVTGEPKVVVACHCTDCQRQSGSAFGETMVVDEANFRLYLSDPEGERRRLTCLDRTRRPGELRLEGARVTPLAEDIGPALERALDDATLALCAESVGGLEAALETAVAYARERTQFGRAIGSFQAVKHKLADLWILYEGARTATREAELAIQAGAPDASLLVSVAKAHVSEAYRQVGFDNIQIHGGVGFTWEYDAHLYLRRAHWAASFLGSAADHHERIARQLETEAA